MGEIDLNWLAVLAAAVAYFVLGGVWYSPVLFAKPFMAGIGKTEEELAAGSRPTMYVWAFVAGLVKALTLAVVLGWADIDGAGRAALLGVVLGLGIHGSAAAINSMFEGRNRNLLWIGVGYDVVGLALAGAILGAMG